MPARTLVALCTKACIKNVRSQFLPLQFSILPMANFIDITDVGNFEYWKIRNVLVNVTSPEQLEEIEQNSPQIRGEDAELWEAFIARDIPDYGKKNWVPKNPLKWCEIYKKYKRWQQRVIDEDKERLRQAMLGIQKEKAQHLTKVVNSKSLPKLPRDPRMLSNDGGVPITMRKKGFAKPPPSALSFAGGSRTKMKDPGSVLTRAIREAKEISARKKLGQPTHQLHTPRSQVLQAPQSMMNEYRKAAEPELKIYTPRKKTSDGVSNAHGTVNGPTLEERERRLRAMKTSRPETAQVTLVGSDSEDEDDLFGEKKSDPFTPSPPPPSKQESRHRPSPIGAKQPQPSSVPKPKPLPGNSSPAPKKDFISSMVAKRKLALAKPSLGANRPQEKRPSDIISSIISQPKPKSEPKSQFSVDQKDTPSLKAPSAGPSSPHGERSSPFPLRKSSPLPGLPPPVLKRKKEVDIFNRTGTAVTKKSRLL
jgi:elongin-A